MFSINLLLIAFIIATFLASFFGLKFSEQKKKNKALRHDMDQGRSYRYEEREALRKENQKLRNKIDSMKNKVHIYPRDGGCDSFYVSKETAEDLLKWMKKKDKPVGSSLTFVYFGNEGKRTTISIKNEAIKKIKVSLTSEG